MFAYLLFIICSLSVAARGRGTDRGRGGRGFFPRRR